MWTELPGNYVKLKQSGDILEWNWKRRKESGRFAEPAKLFPQFLRLALRP